MGCMFLILEFAGSSRRNVTSPFQYFGTASNVAEREEIWNLAALGRFYKHLALVNKTSKALMDRWIAHKGVAVTSTGVDTGSLWWSRTPKLSVRTM